MRIALGLDVNATPWFAAAIDVDSPSTKPREVSVTSTPVPGHDDTIVDAVRLAVDAATARYGDVPTTITLAYPLGWAEERVQQLSDDLTDADGVPPVTLVDSAFTAVIGADARRRIPIGQTVAVVSMRPGGADVRGYRKNADRTFHPVGAAFSADGVVDAELDAALLALVASKVEGGIPAPEKADRALGAALGRLSLAISAARERLDEHETTFVGVRLPGRATVVEVERRGFQDAIAPAVLATVPALRTAIVAATGADTPFEVLVTGDSTSTPLITAQLGTELGIPVLVVDPRRGGPQGTAASAATWAAEICAASTVARAGNGASVASAIPVAATIERRDRRFVEAKRRAMQTAHAKTRSTLAQAPRGRAPQVADSMARAARVVKSQGIAVPSTAAPFVPLPKVAPWRPPAPDASPGPQERRRTRHRPLVAILVPVAAAAAGLVVLGSTAATGALDLTPTNSSTRHPVVSTTQQAVSSDAPTTTPVPLVGGAAQPAPPSGGTDAGAKNPKTKKSSGTPSSGSGATAPSPSTSASDSPAPAPSPSSSDPVPDPPVSLPPVDPDPPTDPPTDPSVTP